MEHLETREYSGDPGQLPAGNAHPLVVFDRWVDDARRANERDFNAFTLTTRNISLQLCSRTVLAKEITTEGIRFFTRGDFPKVSHITWDPNVAGCWHSRALDRQVTFAGRAERMDHMDTLGWWAKRALRSRIELCAELLALTREQIITACTTAPSFGSQLWVGYQVQPVEVNFWVGRPHRRHATARYVREQSTWRVQ